MNTLKIKELWIAAEGWSNGWNANDENSDVIVTLSDESKWVATFFTYQNILSLKKKFKDTGECLGGKYFWASDMILVDEISRDRIAEVIKDLLENQEFNETFDKIE